MSEFKSYPRLGSIEARPYEHGDQASGHISISEADLTLPTLKGGMVARNPDNHDDQWYIAPAYFAKHYGLAADGPMPCWCPYCGEPHSVAQRAAK